MRLCTIIHGNLFYSMITCMNLFSCKWVYHIKYNLDGSIERKKARLVIRGLGQFTGLDCNETFSPIVKPTTIRIVLSIADTSSWVIRQFIVKHAFLHGDLHEKVYMAQTQSFIHPDFPTHVCNLNNSMYGLKQAPRAWFHKFSNFFFLSLGFTCRRTDSFMLILRTSTVVPILLLYVDDIIFNGHSPSLLQHIIYLLSIQFLRRMTLGIFITSWEYRLCELLIHFACPSPNTFMTSSQNLTFNTINSFTHHFLHGQCYH